MIALGLRTDVSPQEVAASTFLVETGSTSGTAFLVEPDLAITAAHVVQGHSFVGLAPVGGDAGAMFGKTVPSFVVYLNQETDLAVLRLLSPSENTPLELVGELPALGAAVSALGAPGGVFAITSGEIVGIDSDGLTSSTAVAPGSSGGPLVDTAGDVAGVVVQYDWVSKDAISVPATQVTEFIESVPEGAWSRVPSTTDGPLIAAWFVSGFLLATVIIAIVITIFVQRKTRKVRAENLIRITIER